MEMSKVFAAALAASTIAGSAFAADLPSRKVAPVVAPVPVFTWTGFYVGANLGYAFGGGNNVNGFGIVLPPATPQHQGAMTGGAGGGKGVLGGLQAGYNWQMGSLVAGLETDIQLASIRGNGVIAGPMGLGNNGAAQFVAANLNARVDWFGTLRARLGFTVAPTFLVYATGGLAYGGVKTSATPVFVNATGGSLLGGATSANSTRIGWTVGAGGEYAFSPNWSMKLEYLYTDLGRSTVNPAGLGVAIGGYFAGAQAYAGQASGASRFHTVRAGLNYRFGGAAAPVVAKY